MEPGEHPVRMLVDDDLHRNRLTVFFRIVLAIPHFAWLFLWSIVVLVVVIVTWFVTLFTGRPPAGLHGFLARYVRYTTHFYAYLYLVADAYPPFRGDPGDYVVDVELPGPAPQSRWKTLLRIVLALPALFLASALGGSVRVYGGRSRVGGAATGGALLFVCAVLGWFAALVTGRMPRGLRDAGAYSIGYGAQTAAYLLVVTDHYPNADPTALLESLPLPPQHPVSLVGDAHDLRRSRLTVFFRLPLSIPHLVWLFLWTVLATVFGVVNWFATLLRGAPPAFFHRFFCAYTRYTLHVYAFLFLTANPFPGFTGEPGRYPLDLELPTQPQLQNRWKTAFRVVLVIPAAFVNGAAGGALLLAAVYTWFVALLLGRAPWGLRNLSAYALRFSAQQSAYLYLLTDRYPHASPLEGGAEPEQLELEPEPAAA